MTTTRISEWVIRSVVRLVARSLFRVRILGKEHIPSPGPALLVPNHLTYFDGFLIGSCLDRVARFLVWKPYYDHKLLGWGFRLAKAIPIWTKPHGGAQAIQRARKALDQGHVVCIFAEGSISRNGDLLPFQRGLEAIVRGLDVPVIPVHLGGLWGSLFSLTGFLGSTCALCDSRPSSHSAYPCRHHLRRMKFVRQCSNSVPDRALAFKRLTPETERMYMASFNSTVDRYRELLSEQNAGSLTLPNDNLDVGTSTAAGQYRLKDVACSQLLHRLQGRYIELPQELRNDILTFYRDLGVPISTKTNDNDWARLLRELDHMQAVDADLRHPSIAEAAAPVSR